LNESTRLGCRVDSLKQWTADGATYSVAGMDSAAAIRALTGLRLAVGAGAWLAPRATGKAFLLAPDDNPQSPYLARLFGARDAALAWGTLDSTGEAQRRWLVAGLACDVADTFAALAGGRRGYLSTAQSVLLAAPAVSAVALGVIALQGSGEAPA
jgi:hypothetical protein